MRRTTRRRALKDFAYVATLGIFVPRRLAAQGLTLLDPAFVKNVTAPPASGSGCTTIKDKFDTSLDTAQFVEVGSGGLGYALSFVAGSTYSGCNIDLWVQKEGAPTVDYKIAIQTDLGVGLGPSQIENGNEVTVNGAAFSTTEGWKNIVGLNPTIVSGVKYWIKFLCSTANGTNNVHWIRDSGSSPTHDLWATFDDDEAAWFESDTTVGYGFRLYEN